MVYQPNFRPLIKVDIAHPLLPEEVTGRQSVVYSMISIFNSLFSQAMNRLSI